MLRLQLKRQIKSRIILTVGNIALLSLSLLFPLFLPCPRQLQKTETLPQISMCQPNHECRLDGIKEQNSICCEVSVFLNPYFERSYCGVKIQRKKRAEKRVLRKPERSRCKRESGVTAGCLIPVSQISCSW